MKNKPSFYLLIIMIAVPILSFWQCNQNTSSRESSKNLTDQNSSSSMENNQLRHVVLFKFKEGTTKEDIAKVEEAFAALPGKIPEIRDFEWGINNSPEGLSKGYTHCFLLTFDSEKDRAVYLPHTEHKAFGQSIGAFIEDVLVIDYWN